MTTIENISATNMRVNLTDIIDGLSVDTAVAVTKHKKVIAYVLSPETYNSLMGIEEVEEDEASPSGLETVMGALSEVEHPAVEQGDLDGIPYLDDESDEEVEEDISEDSDLTDESDEDTPSEEDNESDWSPVEEDFDSFLEELQNETLDRLKATG
jgi:PHD/YefM family antitoxin component YafN of YafNO toxin-antitoxin module